MTGTRRFPPGSASCCFRWASALVLVVLLTRGAAHAVEPGGPQDDPYRSCGLNCLTIMARLHDIDVPHKSIEVLLKPRPNGECSVADIERAASSLALQPVSVHAEWNQLTDLQTPCIVQVRSPTRYATGSHFLILMGLHRNGVILLDPPTQGRMHPYEEFRGDWTGVAILFARDATDKARLVSRWNASASSFATVLATVALVAVLGSLFILSRARRGADSSATAGHQHPKPTSL